jgi:hypothetical protein
MNLGEFREGALAHCHHAIACGKPGNALTDVDHFTSKFDARDRMAKRCASRAKVADIHREVCPVKSRCVNANQKFTLSQARPRNSSALDALGPGLFDNHRRAHRIVVCNHYGAPSRQALVQGNRCIPNDFPHSRMIGAKQFAELVECYRGGIHTPLSQSLGHLG